MLARVSASEFLPKLESRQSNPLLKGNFKKIAAVNMIMICPRSWHVLLCASQHLCNDCPPPVYSIVKPNDQRTFSDKRARDPYPRVSGKFLLVKDTPGCCCCLSCRCQSFDLRVQGRTRLLARWHTGRPRIGLIGSIAPQSSAR